MSIIIWNEKYSVGIKVIDEQHQVWISLINKLHSAMVKGEGSKILADILEEVVNYTKTHLSFEESLFDKYNYPEKAQHKEIHKKFTNQVIDFQKDIKSGTKVMTLDVMNFLRTWLIDHITKTDRKYTDFFNSKGLR